MAMFLSAIDLSNFAENNNSQKIAKLYGTVRGSDNKRRAGVKVIVVGVETVTNDEGEFSFTKIPEGQYYLFVSDYEYKLLVDNQVVSASSAPRLAYRLAAIETAHQPTPQEGRSQMDAAMTQLAKALASSKAAGSETIEGTLLDEDRKSTRLNSSH